METTDFITHLDREGRAMSRAAADAGPDAAVPTCPGWRVRDLIRHTGAVHRWAAAFIAEGRRSPRWASPGPDDLTDTALLTWFDEGHGALVATLRTAPADLECWAFLPAPTPLAFWARRQAHETAIHRLDAEAARGGKGADFVPEFAADGIDELLTCFHARRSSKVRTDTPRVLRFRTTDTGDAWTMRLSAEAPVTTRDASGEADCEVTGTAADVYAAVWNRLPLPAVSGDADVARLWTERSPI